MEPGSSNSSLDGGRVPTESSATLEVVILIGLPGAGKSTFRSQRFTETHAVVSRDLVRHARRPDRRQRRLIWAALSSGMSVVVDDTHASVIERAAIIELARAFGARAVAYFFDSLLPECAARNQLRVERARATQGRLEAVARRLVRPSHGEGFDELVTVRPLPGRLFEVIASRTRRRTSVAVAETRRASALGAASCVALGDD